MGRHHRRPLRRPGVPIHAHPADAAAVHQRAAEIGRAVADAGGLDDASVAFLIGVLAQAATALGYPGDLAGLKTRLAWTAADSRAGRERARRETVRHLQRTAIASIVAGLPLEAVLEAAHRANRAADPPLPDCDVAVLVRTEIAIEARRRDCACCRARAGRD